MGITYENQRVIFDAILKKYKDYVALYRQVNNGSLAGVTTFDDFYWRMTYLSKYQDNKNVGNNGV